jgi:transposase
MRYQLNEFEWTAIKPMLPNKPSGVPRVNDRRVLKGYVLGPAFRCALAGPARKQSLRPLATGWHLGPDHGGAGHRSRCTMPRCR